MPQTPPILIALHGKARTGKDTIGAQLASEFGFLTYGFTEPLKRMTQQRYGLSEAQTWRDSLKETVIPSLGRSPRQLFQSVGDQMRLEDPAYLLRAAADFIAQLGGSAPGIAITDLRTEAEAEWVRAHQGTVWHVHRDSAPAVSPHHTEQGVRVNPSDQVIPNNGSLEDLWILVRERMRTDHDLTPQAVQPRTIGVTP